MLVQRSGLPQDDLQVQAPGGSSGLPATTLHPESYELIYRFNQARAAHATFEIC